MAYCILALSQNRDACRLHGQHGNADARGGNAIYSASSTGFRVYVHSTAGAGDNLGVNSQARAGITPSEASQWGWKIVWLAVLPGHSEHQHSFHAGKSEALWSDAGQVQQAPTLDTSRDLHRPCSLG